MAGTRWNGQQVRRTRSVYGTAQGRRVAEPPRRGGERRRLAQMAVSAVILAAVVAVKLAMPEAVEPYRRQALRLLGEDTDLAAAFSAVGRVTAPDGTVGEALHDAYVAVFGAQPVQEAAEEPAVYTTENTPDNVCLTQRLLGFAYVPPVEGTVTGRFGYRKHPVSMRQEFHYGVDLAADEGTEVHAFAAGTVSVVGESTELGKYVTVAHDGGFETVYAHCSAVTVVSGREVAAGEVIARVGQTGNATGPHLHFELLQGKDYLNPIFYALP